MTYPLQVLGCLLSHTIPHMLYKSQGIIIKRTNWGEFDKLITIYTKEFGKLVIKGKSIRKNQSKLKGHLELFLLTHLMIAPGKKFDIITGAETIESFPRLHQDLPSLYTAIYFSEILDKLIAGPERDENLWQLISNSFQDLDSGNDIKETIKNFENSLLQVLGYGQQKNFIDFIQELINSEIRSYQQLKKII